MTAELIVYAVIAAGLVFWLRNILGTRHGDERERPNPLIVPNEVKNNPDIDPAFGPEKSTITAQDIIIDLAQNPKGSMFIDNKSAENGLLDIAKADRDFDVKQFLNNAQDAFAMIVEAFAEGDKEALQDLTQTNVYKAFESAINDRQQKDQSQTAEIHAISEARIIEAGLKGKTAAITIRFKADQTSVTRDKDGEIIDGNPDRVTTMIDIWTFKHDIKSKDPRWLLAETRGDFDEDNDLIPDTE